MLQVLPHLSNPLQLSDFIVTSFRTGMCAVIILRALICFLIQVLHFNFTILMSLLRIIILFFIHIVSTPFHYHLFLIITHHITSYHTTNNTISLPPTSLPITSLPTISSVITPHHQSSHHIIGGKVGMSALESLIELINKHNLLLFFYYILFHYLLNC